MVYFTAISRFFMSGFFFKGKQNISQSRGFFFYISQFIQSPRHKEPLLITEIILENSEKLLKCTWNIECRSQSEWSHQWEVMLYWNYVHQIRSSKALLTSALRRLWIRAFYSLTVRSLQMMQREESDGFSRKLLKKKCRFCWHLIVEGCGDAPASSEAPTCAPQLCVLMALFSSTTGCITKPSNLEFSFLHPSPTLRSLLESRAVLKGCFFTSKQTLDRNKVEVKIKWKCSSAVLVAQTAACSCPEILLEPDQNTNRSETVVYLVVVTPEPSVKK